MIVRHGWNCSRLHQSRDVAWQWFMGVVNVAVYQAEYSCVSDRSGQDW